MKRLLPLALLASLVLAACATGPRLSDAERLALVQANAGEPQPSFRYFNRLNGWTALGNTALMVWTRPNEAFLLELMGTCPDLPFAPAISITSQMGTVTARFDQVIPRGPGTSTIRVPCRIQTIRPVDLKGLSIAQQEIREASAIEREEDAEAGETPN